MHNGAREVPEWLRGGNDDHLAREAALYEASEPRGLDPTRHNQETVPVVVLGVLRRPPRFASRVVRDVEEADDRNPGDLGTRRVVGP